MSDNAIEGEDFDRGKTLLKKGFGEATQILGNPDDFRKPTRKTIGIYIDGGLVSPVEPNLDFENEVLTVYRGEFQDQYSLATQAALVLNTASQHDYSGSDRLSFTAVGYKSNFIEDDLTDDDKRFQGKSVLFLTDKERKAVPLFYFERQRNYQNEESLDGSSDYSLRVVITEESKKLLSEKEKQSMKKFLLEFSELGFPSLSELNDKDLKFSNPFDSRGELAPTKEFFESDPKASRLRNELAEFAVLLEASFESRNEDAKLIGLLDQKNAEIQNIMTKDGVDWEDYVLPQDLQGYSPYHQTIKMAVECLFRYEEITNLNSNFEDVVFGETRKDEGDLEEPVVEMDEANAGIMSTSDMTDEEKSIFTAQWIIISVFDGLGIEAEEEDRIKIKFNLN